nr:metal-nicotianamine transporter YSL1 [Ipomoea batatas]
MGIYEEGGGGEEKEEEEVAETAARVAPWRRQITVRGLIVSSIIGCIYSVIGMKLCLTTGITPNFNVSAALLGFILVRTWSKVAQKLGIKSAPFTRQENTIIQTCAVACYSIAVGGGLGSYLLGMNKKAYEQTGVDAVGNSPSSYKDPAMGWLTAYLLVVCFIGIFVLVPLSKILIIDYKLTFPTGMATAVLINGFHTKNDKMARKQVKGFVKFMSYSFLWAFFQWFFTGKAADCGFSHFPTFGLQAWKKTFYFDFSTTYVGTGMICPHIVNVSMLLGAVLSWGVMWPLMEKRKGDWFPANLPETSMKSLNGYKVFISIALLLGDGLYNFTKILCFTLLSIQGRFKNRRRVSGRVEQNKSHDDLMKDEIFVREGIPMWVGVIGYIVLTIIAVGVIPMIFHQVKWYWVILIYAITPTLAFCNAYGAGLTDMNMAYNYGKVGLFVMAALAGKENGVIAGLAGCGIVKSVVNVSVNLMLDFKTGHLTLTSSRAMFLSQAIGTIIGCVVAPLSFFLFYNAFDVGNPNGEYKAPFALVYRNLASVSIEGFSVLPQHCLQMCYGFFGLAVMMNLVKDVCPKRIGKWIPVPMAMAVPFIIGGNLGIDMCVGSVIVYVWHKLKSKQAELMVAAVASGMICGEGLWILPASILALAKVYPPICMKFLPS